MRDPDDGLRAIMRSRLRQFHWTSVETGGTGLGIADSNYLAPARLACARCRTIGRVVVNWKCGSGGEEVPCPDCAGQPGIEGWIECKATDGWAVTLTEHQAGWLFRRARLGGRAWIAVRRRHRGGPRLGSPVDELHLVPGALAREARAGGLRDPLVRPASWCTAGGPARWNWAEAADRLLAAPLAVPAGPTLDAPEDVAGASVAAGRGGVSRRRRRGPLPVGER